jgi:hypothetical protein
MHFTPAGMDTSGLGCKYVFTITRFSLWNALTLHKKM